ncbi:uncharacterized protein LOC116599987 [Mustela erminea]|uniref:uncharacterized protein LOC116599987 n=1 Tax=Mustela erminea TaxID=36723 RepID=UPI001386B7B1|nr:uncharacterized protein LOC116599987 [Mustela erminea]
MTLGVRGLVSTFYKLHTQQSLARRSVARLRRDARPGPAARQGHGHVPSCVLSTRLPPSLRPLLSDLLPLQPHSGRRERRESPGTGHPGPPGTRRAAVAPRGRIGTTWDRKPCSSQHRPWATISARPDVHLTRRYLPALWPRWRRDQPGHRGVQELRPQGGEKATGQTGWQEGQENSGRRRGLRGDNVDVKERRKRAGDEQGQAVCPGEGLRHESVPVARCRSVDPGGPGGCSLGKRELWKRGRGCRDRSGTHSAKEQLLPFSPREASRAAIV